MEDPDARARMAATLRRIGHGPKVRMGNGTAHTIPELTLYAALVRLSGPRLWQIEYVVPSGPGSRSKGMPTCYKIDVASPAWMVAVEVDGPSHNVLSRREADRRKDSTLSSRGWLVLRFSNQEVMADPDAVAAKIIEMRSSHSQ
jgi:hypothetical protein